jgi:hypothetical protein
MTSTFTIQTKIRFKRGRGGRIHLESGDAPPPPVESGRVPRVARMLALAIRFQRLIREGVVADQAEIARLGLVTRARVTQIMDLLSLAPDIQEEVLFLPLIPRGKEPMKELQLRQIANVLDWRKQRRLWSELAAGRADNQSA